MGYCSSESRWGLLLGGRRNLSGIEERSEEGAATTWTGNEGDGLKMSLETSNV